MSKNQAYKVVFVQSMDDSGDENGDERTETIIMFM